ncbi:MAG: putative lactonohydrolase [Ilumatobacteraceae bacterium]|nr:putative lactonohydrolase [Ilumatobacteraceae bacterium]
MSELQHLIGGVDFGEGPRWHDGALWYCDFFQRAIYTVSTDGKRETVHSELGDQMSGLGWLPDGRMLVVSMKDKKVLRDEGGTLVEHADLSSFAAGLCNDMVVDESGNAYVGNFGYDFYAGADFAEADLMLVRPDGSVSVAASGLRFPNGSVITPDGSTLIVGESYGGGYEAFAINDDATLGPRRQWAHVEGTAPDGCTLDADGGIWFADAFGSQVVRVVEGGEVTHRVATPLPTFACALGGDDGRTLFVLCATGTHEADVAGKAEGAIYTLQVDSPHAGLP